ncbi:hypothetical protein QN277_012820 [Acacia crassicarpa]|uniref:Uncharacterized protein n=1 Tax=Acacia crassicarpa TaxID=499986 RepID=A0AAE1N2D6_9FABA|nr:hypothetical protein QN277_012820 [Acacia crassicarpa]
MKVGFEVIHGDLNMIRPVHMHESWDYPNINVGLSSSASTSSSSIIPFSKPTPPNIDTTTHNTLNLATNELSDWVEHFTKHLVDDLPAASESTSDHNNHFLPNYQTRSSSHLPHHHDNLVPTPVLYPRKVPFNDLQIQTQTNPLDHQNHDDQNNDGLHLLTLLMECAVAISVDNLNEAHRMLLELTQVVSPYKPSCAERIVAYFAKAMASRVMNSWLGVFPPLIDHRTIHSSFQVFNNISPFIKFAHFTSNQAILEAVHYCDNIHIIDLDIMQGLQWPAFFHILATRVEGRPRVRMTGMGASMEVLVETGKQLTNFAKRLGMSFHFQPIARKFGEIEDVASVVQVRPGETLAVHWLQHSLYDATGPDWKTLRLVEELEPRIITLVEQDVSNGGSFLDRFVGSLHYYSTVFDSLGAYMASEDLNRHKVEHELLAKEINNILAIGGPARSGEDKFRQWRNELARHCFVQIPISPNSMAQAQLILNMFSPPHGYGYTLAHVDGTLRLGWKNTSLYTASAWTCYNSTHKQL